MLVLLDAPVCGYRENAASPDVALSCRLPMTVSIGSNPRAENGSGELGISASFSSVRLRAAVESDGLQSVRQE